jgi:hypothetical protein
MFQILTFKMENKRLKVFSCLLNEGLLSNIQIKLSWIDLIFFE